MFGSCRMCFSPTDKWQDFCNECATRDVPECARCNGALKPDVVFFGESVPRPRVDEAMAHVDASDLLLVVGSSLMVWSGYRFVKRAHDHGIPVAAVNLGKTRADAEIDVKVRADCGEVLQAVGRSLPA